MEQKTQSKSDGGSSSGNTGLTMIDVFDGGGNRRLTLTDIFLHKNKKTLRTNIVQNIASFAFVLPTFHLLSTCKEMLSAEEKIFPGGYQLPTCVENMSKGNGLQMYCLIVKTPNSRRLEWLVDVSKVKELTLPTSASITLVGKFNVERLYELLEESNSTEVTTATFEEMDLKENLLRGMYAYGFQKPSAIQQRGIIPILQGRDTFVLAQTGMGKTALFCIAILQSVDMDVDVVTGCQALVLVPARELAFSIQKVINQLGDYLSINIKWVDMIPSLAIKVHACCGGGRIREDIRILNEGVHIVIGTPGRCYDMINRGALRLDNIKLFCLDGVDEMLSRGFKDQIDDVFKFLPEKVQVCLFSATWYDNVEVFEVTQRFMRNPIYIFGREAGLTLDGIKQFFIAVEREEWKLDTLCDLYEELTAPMVIYCNTRRKVDWLTEKMTSRDFTVSAIHGDMDPHERDLIIQKFRSGSSRALPWQSTPLLDSTSPSSLLITTDILAHMPLDYDVQQVSLVINYDLPTKRENYIHRIGRSRRQFLRHKGMAINFLTASDVRSLRDIEQFYNTQIEEMPMNVADLL